MKSSVNTSDTIIPDDLLKKLEAMPNKRNNRFCEWKDWEDAILLKYWYVKRQKDIAETLGRAINICRDRHQLLTEKEHKIQ